MFFMNCLYATKTLLALKPILGIWIIQFYKDLSLHDLPYCGLIFNMGF